MSGMPIDRTVKPWGEPLSIPANPALTGGRRIGVLLSHGFTGEPSSMTPWARALADKGYAVEVPRLPGHGTSWQDMNTTTWDDWYGEVSRIFDKLCLENDAVVVGGLSMGGALTIRLAEEHNDRIAGLVVVNPAIASGNPQLKLVPVLKHFVGGMKAIGSDIKKPGALEKAYTRTPLKALHQMVKAWPAIVVDLHKITVPVLYLRSVDDHVVDGLSEKAFFAGVKSTDITFTKLTESYHVATLDNDAQQIIDDSAAFIARVTEAVTPA